MAVKITYFVHGKSVGNEQKIFSGWADVELSELGARQSIELKTLIKDKHFDVVFCSDLKRAVQTADIVFGDKYKIVKDIRPRECNYGKYNGQPAKVVSPLIEKSIDEKYPGGESYEDVEARMRDFLKHLRKKYPGKSVALVGHKTPRLALEVIFEGKTWKQAFEDEKKYSWQPGWEYALK